MGTFGFGVGTRRLTRAEIKLFTAAAKRHGAQFNCVAGKEGNCVCGHGCRLDECPIKHFWFTTRDYGSPFNEATARAVEAEIEALSKATK